MTILLNKTNRVFTVMDDGDAVKIMPNRAVEMSEEVAENLASRYDGLEIVKATKPVKVSKAKHKETSEEDRSED